MFLKNGAWCWPCIVAGVSLFTYSSFVLAQVSSPSAGPDYSVWFTLLVGFVVSLLGAYAKGLSNNIKENKNDIKELQDELSAHKLLVSDQHPKKHDMEAMFDRVEKSLTEKITELKLSNNAVHRRLDALHVPSVFPKG